MFMLRLGYLSTYLDLFPGFTVYWLCDTYPIIPVNWTVETIHLKFGITHQNLQFCETRSAREEMEQGK